MRADHLRIVALTSFAASLACASGELPGADGSFTTAGFATTTAGGGTAGRDDDGRDTDRDEGETGNDPGSTCNDGEQNQGESDIDCGGPNCPGCGVDEACTMDSDCQSESCVGNVCTAPSCSDGVKNGGETDVDCGGPDCDPCNDSQDCVDDSDCQSGVCTSEFCAAPSCGDGVLNGPETDVDCGGSCSGCTEGKICNTDTDCLSQYCLEGLCAAADCLSDADCAAFTGQCTVGACDDVRKTCEALASNEGNGCDDGDLCTTGDICAAGTCSSGSPVNCSHLSTTCELGVCNAADGACVTQSANEGNACNDGNACTVASVCSSGQCQDPNAPGYVFHDTFANNAAGWTLGTNWGIGPAATSACSTCPGNDPALDHTPTADNGIAGVVIGGCTPTATHSDYCLTSPVINTTGLQSVWLTYWRHLHADFSPYMVSTVQAFNGSSWQTVWTTGGSPCTNDTNWTEMAHNVSAHSNANFRVRFCYSIGSTGVFASGGWNLDDVTVGPAQCTP
jgi:hypothetical protein